MTDANLNHVTPTSTKKQLRSISERVDSLETTLPQIVTGINQAMVQVDSNMGEFRDTFDAVSEILQGLGFNLADTVRARALRKAQEFAKAQESELETRVSQGLVLPVAAIDEKSLIVGQETDKDGGPVGAGRVQLEHSKLKPEFQAALLGQAVGFSMDLPHGGKFTVAGVYKSVEKADESVPAACEGCAADPGDCEACTGGAQSSD